MREIHIWEALILELFIGTIQLVGNNANVPVRCYNNNQSGRSKTLANGPT